MPTILANTSVAAITKSQVDGVFTIRVVAHEKVTCIAVVSPEVFSALAAERFQA